MGLDKLYKNAERAMMRDVYPELCALMQEKFREHFKISIPNFAPTIFYPNGNMMIWTHNPEYNERAKALCQARGDVYDVEEKAYVLLGNVLTDLECPRYIRTKNLDISHHYIEFCEKILEITMTLRNEEKRLEMFINTADAFASSKPRTILTEKVVG